MKYIVTRHAKKRYNERVRRASAREIAANAALLASRGYKSRSVRFVVRRKMGRNYIVTVMTNEQYANRPRL